MSLSQSPSSQSVYNTNLIILTNDQDGEKERLLWEIIDFEKNPPKREYPIPGFKWYEVHGDPRTLNSLVTRGILNIVFKSNKSCSNETIDREAVKRALNDYRGLIEPPRSRNTSRPTSSTSS